MTERVDFYVLTGADAKERRLIACRLAEKAYLRDLRVAIVSDTAAEAKVLDDLLWTFNDRAFVPHQFFEHERFKDGEVPVHLTASFEAAGAADLLVNLTDRLPPELGRFARIAEIIDADPERRRLGRERFRSYREHKLSLETHQLDAAAEL